MAGQIKKNIAKGAIERIADLERNNLGLVQALNQLMMQSNDRFNSTAEVIAAIVEKIGPDVVEKIVEEKRIERDAAQVARAEVWLATQVKEGKLVVADVLSDKSTLVGVEYTAEGEPVPPGRIQIPFSSVLPDLRPQLEGKGPGTRITTSGGTTFEVLEIYDAAVAGVVGADAPDLDALLKEAGLDTPEGVEALAAIESEAAAVATASQG